MADFLIPYYDPNQQQRPYAGAPQQQQSYAGAPPQTYQTYGGFPQQQQSYAGAPPQTFGGAPQQQQSYAVAPPQTSSSLIDLLDTPATPTGWNTNNTTSLIDMPATATGWNTSSLSTPSQNNVNSYNHVTPSPNSTYGTTPKSDTYNASPSNNNYAPDDIDKWSCPQCTLLNSRVAPVCAACHTINPTVIKEAARGSTRQKSAPYSSYPSPSAPPAPSSYGAIGYGDSYRGGGEGYEVTSTSLVPLEQSNYNNYERNGGAMMVRPPHALAMQPYIGNYSITQAEDESAYYYDTHDNETPIERKHRRRVRRRLRMVAGGATGLVAGSLVLGPVGTVAGCVAGVAAARAASKNGEQKKDAKRLTQQLQHQSQPPRLEY